MESLLNSVPTSSPLVAGGEVNGEDGRKIQTKEVTEGLDEEPLQVQHVWRATRRTRNQTKSYSLVSVCVCIRKELSSREERRDGVITIQQICRRVSC